MLIWPEKKSPIPGKPKFFNPSTLFSMKSEAFPKVMSQLNWQNWEKEGRIAWKKLKD